MRSRLAGNDPIRSRSVGNELIVGPQERKFSRSRSSGNQRSNPMRSRTAGNGEVTL